MQFELEFGVNLGDAEKPRDSRIVVSRSRTSIFRQPTIPNLEPGRIHKLFFAIRLEGATAAAAFSITERSRLIDGTSRYDVPRRCLHISLTGVAAQEGIPESLLRRTRAAASLVRAQSFDLSLDRLQNFRITPPDHALVLLCGTGLAPLLALHDQIVQILRERGFTRIRKSALPHATLRYRDSQFNLPPVDPICWRVRRFVLIESPQGSGLHNIQGVWSLDANG